MCLIVSSQNALNMWQKLVKNAKVMLNPLGKAKVVFLACVIFFSTNFGPHITYTLQWPVGALLCKRGLLLVRCNLWVCLGITGSNRSHLATNNQLLVVPICCKDFTNTFGILVVPQL